MLHNMLSMLGARKPWLPAGTTPVSDFCDAFASHVITPDVLIKVIVLEAVTRTSLDSITVLASIECHMLSRPNA